MCLGPDGRCLEGVGNPSPPDDSWPLVGVLVAGDRGGRYRFCGVLSAAAAGGAVDTGIGGIGRAAA